MDALKKVFSWFSGLSGGKKAIVIIVVILAVLKINLELTPEWEKQGYKNAESYEEALKGGFNHRFTYEYAKEEGISTQAEWDAFKQAERLAKQKQEEEKRLAEEQAKQGIAEKAEQLKSPSWNKLKSLPTEVRGFRSVPSGCGVQYNETMRVYSSFATVYGANALYVMSYTQPASGSQYEKAPAWNNPRKNHKVGKVPLEVYDFTANDGDRYVLLLKKSNKSSGYEVLDIVRINEQGVTDFEGYLRNGKVIDAMTALQESMNNAPGSSFSLSNVGKVGINEKPLESKRCQLIDYDDIADVTLYVQSGGTTSLRKLAEQF